MADAPTKTCPRCGGVILAAAIKCKHCRSQISEPSPSGPSPERLSSPAEPAGHKVIKCAKCGGANDAQEAKCVHCGLPLAKSWSRGATIAVAVGVVGMAAVLVARIVAVNWGGKADPKAGVAEAAQAAAANRAKEDAEAETLRCCQRVADKIRQRQFTSDDAPCFNQQQSALARRIQYGVLETSDLNIDKSSTPCGDGFFGSLADAATRSTTAWSGLASAGSVSEDLFQLLGQGSNRTLTFDAAKALTLATEARANRDLRTARQTDDLKSAQHLCGLARSLLNVSSPACKRAESKADRLEKRESALRGRETSYRPAEQDDQAEVRRRPTVDCSEAQGAAKEADDECYQASVKELDCKDKKDDAERAWCEALASEGLSRGRDKIEALRRNGCAVEVSRWCGN